MYLERRMKEIEIAGWDAFEAEIAKLPSDE